jgi:hypothetical protein
MRQDLFAEVEIKINLRAPPVRVRREGIPDVARFQRRQAHDQLAALDAALMDEFVNGPLVRRFLRAEVDRRGLGISSSGRMRGMRGTAQEIKLRRVFRIAAFKGN